MSAATLALARRCSAMSKQSGLPCRAPALHGLPTCRFHGSATKAGKEKRRRIIEAERVERGIRTLIARHELPDETSIESLQRITRDALSVVDVLREVLAQRGSLVDDHGEPSQLGMWYLHALEKVARVLTAAVDREHASVERAGRIEEGDAKLYIELTRAAVYDPTCGLTAEQARAVLLSLQRRLMAAAA